MTNTRYIVTPNGHGLGWHPSLPGLAPPKANTEGLDVIKDEVDPRKAMPKILNQGQLGACTANATSSDFQYDAWLDGNKIEQLSRLFIYYQERKIEGMLGKGDTGAYGHDAFTVAKEIGIPPETDWPYDISTFEGPVPEIATKAESYYKLTKEVHTPKQDKEEIKRILSNNQTISYGFTVYENFEDESWFESGKMPEPKGQILGGHENLLVGYLEEYPDYVLSRNSWGLVYGTLNENAAEEELEQEKGGYFLMPWDFFLNPNYVSDLRTIVRPL